MIVVVFLLFSVPVIPSTLPDTLVPVRGPRNWKREGVRKRGKWKIKGHRSPSEELSLAKILIL